MVEIKTLFLKYSLYFNKLRARIMKELKRLPKGVVRKRKIKRWYYYYLVYRKGNKVYTDYIGKNIPKELMKQIKRRQTLRRRLFEIENNLYTLGVARRMPRGLGLRKRFEVFKRDNFTCQYCGKNVKKHKVVLTIDHVHPKKKGGRDDSSNLITSCLDCNIGKRDNLLQDTSASKY